MNNIDLKELKSIKDGIKNQIDRESPYEAEQLASPVVIGLSSARKVVEYMELLDEKSQQMISNPQCETNCIKETIEAGLCWCWNKQIHPDNQVEDDWKDEAEENKEEEE